jgi:hypothetical protein
LLIDCSNELALLAQRRRVVQAVGANGTSGQDGVSTAWCANCQTYAGADPRDAFSWYGESFVNLGGLVGALALGAGGCGRLGGWRSGGAVRDARSG